MGPVDETLTVNKLPSHWFPGRRAHAPHVTPGDVVDAADQKVGG